MGAHEEVDLYRSSSSPFDSTPFNPPPTPALLAIAAEEAEERKAWHALYGEPFPETWEEQARLLTRCGLSADADWNFARSLVEGYLLRLKDRGAMTEPAPTSPGSGDDKNGIANTFRVLFARDVPCDVQTMAELLAANPQMAKREASRRAAERHNGRHGSIYQRFDRLLERGSIRFEPPTRFRGVSALTP
jgi:hypothetical protein